jgi:D-alanyl-D-alanine carboxypeptidase (penicillin-binding protein 5/6)
MRSFTLPCALFCALAALSAHATAQSPIIVAARKGAPAAPAASAPVVVQAQSAAGVPSVAAASWVLVDTLSGQTLGAGNADERRDPASLTKLMTAYVAFGAIRSKAITPSQMVQVSQRAWKEEGSRMFIEPRKAVSVDELLHGVIIQSGNDASVAIAELVAGTEDAFVEKMNAEAARLKLTSTHFTNATAGRIRSTTRPPPTWRGLPRR